MRRSILLAALLAALPAAAEPNALSRFTTLAPGQVNGRWNGVDLEKRSNCASEQNNGSRGTYAQFDVTADATTFVIAQSGITGLNCTYSGSIETIDHRPRVTGTLSCSDGKRGDFQTTAIDVSPLSLAIQMSIHLTATESCSIDALISMARQPS
jgi:hypothetical protein